MRLFFFLLMVFAVPLASFGQANYKPGYFVDLKGDTVKGLVDYKGWARNPETADFKKVVTENATKLLNTGNCHSFGVYGKDHFRLFANAHISTDAVEMPNLRQGVDSGFISKTVFLRVLTDGKFVALFSYADKLKTRYYLLNKNEKLPVELVYRIYYDTQAVSSLKTETIYRNQLLLTAQKYGVSNDKLYNQIASADYFDNALIKIVKAINGGENTAIASTSNFGIGLYAGTGLAIGNLGFDGFINYPRNSYYFPKLAMGLDVFLNKNTKKIALRVDLSYSRDSHSYTDGPDASGNSSTLGNIMFNNISVTPQIKLSVYNSEKLKLFLDAGLSVNFTSYNSYHYKEYTLGALTLDNSNFLDFQSFWFGFPLKAGAVFNNHLELYGGYLPETSITNNYRGLSGNYSQYQVGINYLFDIK